MDAMAEDFGVLYGSDVHGRPDGVAVQVAEKAPDPEQWDGHG
jgi:hypothetical protein